MVDIPCKIGDTVWILRRYHGIKHAKKGIVSEMQIIPDRLSITDEMKLLITVRGIARGYWGKEVFATYEEAEKAKESKWVTGTIFLK